MHVYNAARTMVLILIAILFFMIRSAFGAEPGDWKGSWNVLLSESHPSAVSKIMIINDF